MPQKPLSRIPLKRHILTLRLDSFQGGRSIDLQELERSAIAGTDQESLLKELARLDQSTAAISVPLHSLEAQWIELRQFVHDMRDRLEAM